MHSMIKNRNLLFILLVVGLAGTLALGRSAFAQDGDGDDEDAVREALFAQISADIEASKDDPEAPAMGATPCTGGSAGPYACNNIDLLAFLPLGSIGGGSGNDIWGWTDPLDGKEYALMGRSSGTAFVDISDPVNPVYLGNLPTHTASSDWRDIKVYNNYAFIVSEASGHGMQVFDLTKLRNVVSPPVTFAEDAHYSGFSRAHNLVINEDTGYAYRVGGENSVCAAGLHAVNIQNPLSPTFAGCFSADGYTHDAQCVVYSGPDTDYLGDEICFAYNEDTLTVVNFTNKNSPVQIARKTYTGSAYSHQGWITEDQQYLLLDDELDEGSFGHNTRTRVWDITNLDNPVLIDFFDGPNDSRDHNLYIKDGLAYESNYTSGLHIMDLANVATGDLELVAYFDTYPSNNGTSFNGSWSNYPFFESGVVIVSDINSGLFILQPVLGPSFTVAAVPGTLQICKGGEAAATINVADIAGYTGTVDLSASSLPLGSSAVFAPDSVIVPGSAVMTVTVSTTPKGNYSFDVDADDGSLQNKTDVDLVVLDVPSPPSAVFPVNGAVNINTNLSFGWTAIGGATGYHIEIAADAGFADIVDSAATVGASYPVGVTLQNSTTYYWRVSADNGCGPGLFSAAFSFTTKAAVLDMEIFLPIVIRD